MEDQRITVKGGIVMAAVFGLLGMVSSVAAATIVSAFAAQTVHVATHALTGIGVAIVVLILSTISMYMQRDPDALRADEIEQE